MIPVPLWIAPRIALYRALQEQGISNSGLARRLGVRETIVRRMLDPDHATKSARLEEALRALGKPLKRAVGASRSAANIGYTMRPATRSQESRSAFSMTYTSICRAPCQNLNRESACPSATRVGVSRPAVFENRILTRPKRGSTIPGANRRSGFGRRGVGNKRLISERTWIFLCFGLFSRWNEPRANLEMWPKRALASLPGSRQTRFLPDSGSSSPPNRPTPG